MRWGWKAGGSESGGRRLFFSFFHSLSIVIAVLSVCEQCEVG